MPTTKKKIVRIVRRAKAPNPVSVAVAADDKPSASEPSPASHATDAADTCDHNIEDAREPLPTVVDASIASVSISKEASSIEPIAAESLAVNPVETTCAKPLAKSGTKIIKRVRKIVRKKNVPAPLFDVSSSTEPLAAEALSLDPVQKNFTEPQARYGQKNIICVRKLNVTESPPAVDASGASTEVAHNPYTEDVPVPETTVANVVDASIAALTNSELEPEAYPSIELVSVETPGLESSETTTAKPSAKSRPRIIKHVRKVVRRKVVPEPVPVIDAGPTIEDAGEPQPEPEKETVATSSSVSSLPVSELASEKAPSLKTLAAEALAVKPTESGLKAIKRVRKVVRRKIVKKLVPKGSLTTKKVDAIPKQDDTENTAKCHKAGYPSPTQDNSIRPQAAVPLSETSDNNAKLNGIHQSKHVKNGLKSQMDETEKFVSIKSENSMKSKKHCDQVKAKCDILDGRNSGDQAEISELEYDLDGLSERMKRRRTEIFVGGLDRNAKEEDLKRVFGKVGEILEVRIMMDGQTGKNKGYAFLRYAEPSQAKRAVAELTRVEICGKTCGAAAVQSDAIFIGNIDKKWRDEDVIKLLKEAGVENIDTVKVVMDSNNTDSNRGYAFLELETNADAQRAYKKLQKKNFLGKGKNIKVSWADSFTITDEEEMKKVKSVYAEGVPDSWDEVKLKDSFKKFGEIERIVLSRNIKSAKRRDFAFINYKTREAALSCIQTFSNEELSDNGSKINLKVALAKRVQKVKQIKGGQNSTNNYVLKEKYNPVQGLVSQDYSAAVQGAKRTFSSLGDDTLYSDLRRYTRPRLDSSFGLPGSSYYDMMSHGLADTSLPHYQHRPLPSAYSTGSFYGSSGHTNQIIRQGAPPHTSSLYSRFRSYARDGNEFL